MISLTRIGSAILHRYRYWIFALSMGIVLAMLEVLDLEPVFSIAAFAYWSLLIYWAALWIFDQIRTTLRQKKEKTNVELLHLQSQVSPHFFFNTLNNLYGLIEKDAKKAQQLVLKLSDMMRYSIYDGQKESVTLEEEVKYINNYLELQTARYHKKIETRFTTHIHAEGIRLKPLLFIILVENAFKHGVENLREKAYVHIHLSANENEISFMIENNFEEKEPEEIEGIGLKNLQRRLELVYSKKYSLSQTANNNIYKVYMTLKRHD